MTWAFSAKLLIREWRSGALTLLFISVCIAVMCISAIALVNSRIHNAILDEATQLLAADAQVRGSLPIDPAWVDEAKQSQLDAVLSTHFSAMAFSESASQLASIKAVSEGYPLKGAVMVADEAYGEGVAVAYGPAPGQAWMTPRLFDFLGIQVGDSLEIGNHTFVISKALIKEPDSPQTYFNTAPRILIHRADVEATGAVRVGSRVRYGLMLAGDKRALARYEAWLENRLGEHHRWITIDESNQFVGSALQRAQSYIFLAGSLCVLLAGIAIALSARRFASQQLHQVALLKTVGTGPKAIQSHYLRALVTLGLGSALVGTLLGWLMHLFLLWSLRRFLADPAAADLGAYFIGGLAGLGALIGFAAPTFIALKRVPPLQVLQNQFNGALIGNIWILLSGTAVMCLMTFIFSRNVTVTVALLAGILLCFVFTVLLAGLLSSGLSKAAHWLPSGIRFGIQTMARHKQVNLAQISVFALIFLFLYTLILVSSSLLNTWQKQIPEDAPNHFIFNIFATEREKIEQFLDTNKIKRQPFYPMVRGRVQGVDALSLEDLTKQNEHHVNYERELNLTWSQDLSEDNKLLEGQWWSEENNSDLLISVETDFAKGLDLQLGDKMHFSIAGSDITAEVYNIRSVQWDSMNPNFYIIFNKPMSDSLIANWMTSFYLAQADKPLLNDLIRQQPTLSLIELDQTLEQVQSIIQRVSLAVKLIWVMILIAGVLVLITSVQSTLDVRLKEGAIMRTLGASKKLVRTVLLVEFACIGLLAGLLATSGAELIYYLIQDRVFGFAPQFHGMLWFVGPLITVILISFVGLVSTRRIVRTNPMVLLGRL